VLLLYLTNYVHVVTMGMFYRSTKPLLAPVLMATAFYLLALIGEHARAGDRSAGGKRAPWVVFVLFCAMSLLDRQGFFYAVVGLAILLGHAAIARGRRDVALAGAAAVMAMILYNLVLAPLIVLRVNAYTPSFQYQQVPLNGLLTDPAYWWRAGELALQAVSVLAGSLPYWLWAGVAVASLILALRGGRGRTFALTCGFVVLAQVVMFAAMIARHPPVYEWEDHRLWYYPLPFQALLATIMVVLLSRILATGGMTRTLAVNVLLAAAVASNVSHWDDYRAVQLRSRWFPTVYHQTSALKDSLKEGRPRLFLNPEYAGFYDFCLTLSPALRSRAAGPRVADSAGQD
jgi:hypothetical protein